MVLLVKIQESSIVENLKKRYMDDYIFVSFSCRYFCVSNGCNEGSFTMSFPARMPFCLCGFVLLMVRMRLCLLLYV